MRRVQYRSSAATFCGCVRCQVYAALPAASRDGRSQAHFGAKRPEWKENVLDFDLRNLSHAQSACDAKQGHQTIAFRMSQGCSCDVQKMPDFPRLDY